MAREIRGVLSCNIPAPEEVLGQRTHSAEEDIFVAHRCIVVPYVRLVCLAALAAQASSKASSWALVLSIFKQAKVCELSSAAVVASEHKEVPKEEVEPSPKVLEAAKSAQGP